MSRGVTFVDVPLTIKGTVITCSGVYDPPSTGTYWHPGDPAEIMITAHNYVGDFDEFFEAHYEDFLEAAELTVMEPIYDAYENSVDFLTDEDSY